MATQIYVYDLVSAPEFPAFQKCTSFFTIRIISRTLDKLYHLTSISLMFFIPLFIIIYCYISIYNSVKKQDEERE